MAKLDKKTLILGVAGVVLLASLALNVKSCSSDRQQNKKIDDLEKADSALAAVDAVLYKNDSILNARTNDLRRGVDVLRDDVDSLRKDVDSLGARVAHIDSACCDCNKKRSGKKQGVSGKTRKPDTVYVAPTVQQPTSTQTTTVTINGVTYTDVTSVNRELNVEALIVYDTIRQRIR